MRRRILPRAAPPAAHERARHAAGITALAEALMHAGRGEPIRALEGLAAMVVNRVAAARARRAPPAWGMDLAAAARMPGLLPAAAGQPDGALRDACRRIAARAAAGSLPDPTGGALFCHRIGTPRPEDAPAGETVRLGGIVFIRPVEAAEPDDGPAWATAERA